MGDYRRNSRDESTLPRYALFVTRYSLFVVVIHGRREDRIHRGGLRLR